MKPSTAKEAKKAKGTGATFVYDALRRLILTLELEPGSVIDEVALGRRYNVSRSPVREAVVKLAANGLVETLPNRSSIVARIRFETLGPFLAAQEVVYRLTAREAALRRGSEDVAKLKDIQARHDALRDLGDFLGLIELNREFHLTIARIAGNAWFERWLQSLMDEGQRVMGLYIRALGHQIPAGELKHHHEIIAAIEAGDAVAADEAGRRDADVIRRQVVAMLSGSSVAIDLAVAAE